MSRPRLTPDDLRRVLDVDFTDEQLAAVTAPLAPSVVIAGAGSGKTTVMSARVVWLVGSGLVAPDQVLGLTFTNKAAAELSARVRRALSRLATTEVAVPEGAASIGTYHSYAGGLLREYGLHAGLEPAAPLLVDAARYQLAERVVRRAAGPFDFLGGPIPEMARAVVSLDGELNEHLVEPAAVRQHDEHLLAELAVVQEQWGKLTARPATAGSTARARAELLALVEEFRREKRRRGVVDFGDQMAGAALLAEQHALVGDTERDRYRAVLLDEYQDTSVTQKRLLLALFGRGHPVTAVGDPFQAIYGWRGASVQNITQFAEEFTTPGLPTPVLPLAQNNRSGERILDLANAVAEPLRAAHPAVGALVPRPDLAGRGGVHVALYDTFSDEVQALGADIERRVAAGQSPGSIAVLCRTASEFATYHRALLARGLPVEVVGLAGLLELPEVADLVATLQVIDDPAANTSLVRLMSGPRWRIGARDLAMLGARARALVAARQEQDAPDLAAALSSAVAGIDPAEVVSLGEAIHDLGDAPFSLAARERLGRLDAELTELRRHRGNPLPDLVRQVLDATGLGVEVEIAHHAATVDSPDHLAAFVSLAATFADLDGAATLGSFLAFLAASHEYDSGLDSTKPSSADTVKVMTIHKAKGLEWPTVYLPNVTDGVFPSKRGRSLWTSKPEVLPFTLRGDCADFPSVSDWTGNSGCKRFGREMAERDAVEERRLAYVAVTRAAQTVVLSGHWWGPSQKRPRGPSPFLVTAHDHCESGGGQIDHWQPPPPEGATNPVLAEAAIAAWPPALDPVASAARRDGAALVRRAMAEPSPRVAAGQPGETVVPAVVAEWDDDLTALLAEAAAAADPRREVLLPTPMSASALVWLARDPQGLAAELARPMPRPPALAASRGTRFHEWVEMRFGQEPLIDLDALSEGEPPTELAELAQLQRAFLDGPYAERAPLAVEAPFQLVLGGRVVSGRIDAVYAAPAASSATFEVVDWKTGRLAADPMQLAIYRLAWAELHEVPIESVAATYYYVSQRRVERPTELPGRAELETLLSGHQA